MAHNDPVQEYLDRLRSLGPSEKLSRDIDEVEREHHRKLAARSEPRRKIRPGFRSPKET